MARNSPDSSRMSSQTSQRPLSPIMGSGPLSPLLIGRPCSPGDGTAIPYLSRVMVSTPKTVRPVVDLQMPRRHVQHDKPLSSFVQEQNFEMDRRIKAVNSHYATQDKSGDKSSDSRLASPGQVALERGLARTALDDALNKLVSGVAAKAVVEVIEEEPEDKGIKGATSVPKFTNIKEQNEWYLNRAKTDIQKCKPNLGQGQAGAELTKMLPPAQAFEIDNFRRDNEGLNLLKARIDDRSRKLASRKGMRPTSCSPDPKHTFVHKNRLEVGLLPSHKLNATKLRTQSRREAVRSNYALNQSKKTEWHRELMRSVEVKTAHADAVILKRKQDAMRERTRIKSQKLLAVCTAAVRIGLMAAILPKARKRRVVTKRESGAADTILKFYRIYFAMVHFRRYKECLKKLSAHFKKWLPMWRIKRQMKIANTIVKFTQGLSGAGGTAAAIKAYKAKMTGLQTGIRRYLRWKHHQIKMWQNSYDERRELLAKERDEARNELFQKAIREGHPVELDVNGDPVGLKQWRVEHIGPDVSTEQLLGVFTNRRLAQRERIKLYQAALAKFSSECRHRMRLRIVQKNIQGDKFDIEKLLKEEEKKGMQNLVCPKRPDFNTNIVIADFDKMIEQGSRVMQAAEELEISETAKVISGMKFTQALKRPSSEEVDGASAES